jgi:hypothetical protein
MVVWWQCPHNPRFLSLKYVPGDLPGTLLFVSMVLAGLVMGLMGMQEVKLSQGMVIRESVTVAKGDYLIAGGGVDAPALVIEGDGITVDFSGAILRGTKATVEPNERDGVGIVVRGKNVTLRGLTVRGYKVGLYVEGVEGFRLLDSDLSYNWKQKLKSGRMKEDVSDWMSFHQNENDEWLRFGAGVYLRGVKDFEVRNVTITGGQCGLMMTESHQGKVWNNDFSFLSAIGIGMYRSSDNFVMHNKVDWCVRGYSHRFYNRGQDSAGILMYEQCMRNTVAYNSVTHSGDGLFLWAGQSTMDSGEGGCNDNVFYGNDFSHAPTNGIETTFSRNQFINNLVLECWHGVWGGYSYDSKFIGNTFGLNWEAIAIEHGQDNEISGNIFRMDTNGIYLWMRESLPPNEWGYPKQRDTKSRDYLIQDNVMFGIPGTAFIVDSTSNLLMKGNFVKKVGKAFELGEGVRDMVDEGGFYSRAGGVEWPDVIVQKGTVLDDQSVPVPGPYMERSGLVVRRDADPGMFSKILRESKWNPMVLKIVQDKSKDDMSPEELRDLHAKPYYVAPLDEGIVPFLGPDARRGRTEILVDEWGPVDFRSPILWLEDWYDSPTGGKYYVFRVVGPDSGGWTFSEAEGCIYTKFDPAWQGVIPTTPPFVEPGVATLSGDMGDRILVRAGGQFSITLSYLGAKTIDYRGVETPADTAIPFGYKHDEVAVNWLVSFFNYDRATIDPRENVDEFRKIYESEPVVSQRMSSLEGAWSGSPAEGVTANAFATLAEGRVTVEPGSYTLSVTSDDGVRVLVDEIVVFEDWTWHAPKTDDIVLELSGRHSIRIEHFELDGYSALQVRMRKNKN